MINEIYLNFDGELFNGAVMISAGINWRVEWCGCGYECYVGTGDWQYLAYGYNAKGSKSIRIFTAFTEEKGDIIGLVTPKYSRGLIKADVSHCSHLMYFKNYCARTVDVSCNPFLKDLSCINGRFDVLDLSENAELEKLSVWGCKNLTELNLSGNPALRELDLTLSGVRKIELGNCSALQSVVLDRDMLDDASMASLRRTLKQNGGKILRTTRTERLLRKSENNGQV